LAFSNPGTGGAGGPGDGFLTVTNTTGIPNFFGARSFGPEYTGDWSAAGVQAVRVFLNDIGVADGFEIHFCIGTLTDFWQYNPGFVPLSNLWSAFTADLTDSTAFTHIIATDGFGYAWALEHATAVLLRHDHAPFAQFPDNTVGDLGIDRFELVGGGVSVDGPAPVARPSLSLGTPYPNPSRGPVAIGFQLGDASPVTFEVVDVQGRLVRRVTLPAGPAGLRTWMWDGRDQGGRRVAAGSYRVRASSPSAGDVNRSVVRLGD
jgi:hypothetical protein